MNYLRKVWKRLSLRRQVLFLLVLIVLLTLAGGSFTFIYAIRMNAFLTEMAGTHLFSIRIADQMAIAIANLKGFVSYYYIERDPQWLEKMKTQRIIFLRRLNEAKKNTTQEEDRAALDRIEKEYAVYTKLKDRVIEFYKRGEIKKGVELHRQVREKFFNVLKFTNEYSEIHNRKIRIFQQKSRRQAERMMILSLIGMSFTFFLAIFLAFILFWKILDPIKRLSMKTKTAGPVLGNEVAQLSNGIHNLIEDMDQTRSELKKSRNRLVLSERMAVVGKLAAEVAHSIRNPLTSIKMRLFSLEKKLEGLTEEEKDDIEAVQKELWRLDNIVQNFLEFSRPPKLKKQPLNVSEVVDNAFQLLQYRLGKQNIKVIRRRPEQLPPVEADPELLKEVIVNIIINALEAMDGEGKLIVSEEDAVAENIGWTVIVKITDTGPGVPVDIRGKITEPFFSTKETGTGLGLSIAERIIEEHGGQLSLSSVKHKGATFYIILPVMENPA